MPKKKNNNEAVKRVAVIGAVLIVAQLIYLYAFDSKEPMTIRQAIRQQVDKSGADPQEKARKEILAALYDFRTKNNGKFPATLNELTPTYFDRVPVDATTGKPYAYTLENNVPFIGERSTVLASKSEIKNAQDALIASLSEDSSLASFVYDPTGKRDPFRPFDFAPKLEQEGKTPLEKYSLGQLKLTAILGAGESASAMVENALGKGFTVRKGTKIGSNNGEVVEIQPDRLLILESTVDFTGQTKTRTIEMRLRTKDQENSVNNP